MNNIVFYLLSEYFYNESINTILLVIICFLINLIHTNGISLVIANIIQSIENKSVKNSYTFFYLFLFLSTIYLILYYLYKLCQNKLLTKIKPWIRFQLTKMVLLQNNENISSQSFISLNPHINRMSHILFMMSNDFLTFFLPVCIFLIVIAGYLFYHNTIIGSVFILGNLSIIAYTYSYWGTLLDKNEKHEVDDFESEKYLIEMLNNFDKIIYRGQTSNEISIFETYTNDAINSGYNFYSSVNVYETAMNTLAYIMISLIIGYSIWLFFDKKLTSVVFITLLTILMLYRDKIGVVIQQVTDIVEFMGRISICVDEFTKRNVNTRSLSINKEYSPVKLPFDNVVFEHVSFQYKPGDKKILDDFNLSLSLNKKIIGITGPSGKGKSTFAKLMLKMYDFSGNIYIDGVNIREIDADYIRQNIVYTNQNAKLFNKKIFENIQYGCENPEDCDEQIKLIFEKYSKIRDLYKGIDIYEKSAGSLGEGLSGGQRQVINIIGAFIQKAPIVILDEPTNALDGNLKNEILRFIQDYSKQKKSIIIITHDRDIYPLFQSTVQI